MLAYTLYGKQAEVHRQKHTRYTYGCVCQYLHIDWQKHIRIFLCTDKSTTTLWHFYTHIFICNDNCTSTILCALTYLHLNIFCSFFCLHYLFKWQFVSIRVKERERRKERERERMKERERETGRVKQEYYILYMAVIYCIILIVIFLELYH